MRDTVLMVGYSPRMIGGVTAVTTLLLAHIPYLELHVAVRCYRPRWKALALSAYSIAVFVMRLVFAAPTVIQVVVASRGDTLKMLPYIVLAKCRGCKVCLYFHNKTSISAVRDGFPTPIRRLILSVWRWANCYCFVSNALRQDAVAYLSPRKPQIVIPNAIAESWLREEPLPRHQRTGDLVFLGRWCPEKGSEELLSAMRGLVVARARHCDIYSDHRVKENPENCAFHGWLPENEVRRVLRESTILLVPSHAEAFGLVLLEAAACGTPFISTNIPGITDIARESQAGLLHEVGDVQGMRRAIGRLLADQQLWSDCSRNGRCWAHSLEISQILPQWHRLYADLGMNVPVD